MLRSLLIAGSILLTLAACTAVSPTHDVARTALVPAMPARGSVCGTATRLPVSPGECAQSGESYTRDDIQRTGETELGPALRDLDPALTVRGR